MGGKKRKILKNASGLMDQDYRSKLSPEDREYLDKFNDEYYQNRFKNDGTDIHSDAHKPEIRRNNAARDRDVMSPARYKMANEKEVHRKAAKNTQVAMSETAPYSVSPSPEDVIIEAIDKSRRGRRG